MASPELNVKAAWEATTIGREHAGHAHFWDRALTRRQALRLAAGTAAGTVFALPGVAGAARTATGMPRAIPGGTQVDGLGFFHFFFPSDNPFSTNTVKNGTGDISTITDFVGFVGVGDWSGGTGRDPANPGTTLFWNADVRFMDGTFFDTSGRPQHGSFAFV